jgi:ferrochelatase
VSVGVLVMAYGTPRDRDDIAAYYTDIRRGSPPPQHLLDELVMRYDAIGGTFPLREITERQCAAIADALGEGFTVALGQKHADPRVEDGVDALAARGVDRIVGLVLAPHYSTYSVKQYADRAAAAAAAHSVPVETVEDWHLLPAYVDFLAGAVSDALTGLPDGSEVLFTAHSLPERIVAEGDPYPDQLRQTAAAVAARLGLERWSTGWQSAGRTADPWLGPDVLDVVRAKAPEVAGLLVCACGFVADHLEVAYDLDVDAAKVAAEVGLRFARTRSVNDDPAVMRGLAALVASRAGAR